MAAGITPHAAAYWRLPVCPKRFYRLPWRAAGTTQPTCCRLLASPRLCQAISQAPIEGNRHYSTHTLPLCWFLPVCAKRFPRCPKREPGPTQPARWRDHSHCSWNLRRTILALAIKMVKSRIPNDHKKSQESCQEQIVRLFSRIVTFFTNCGICQKNPDF